MIIAGCVLALVALGQPATALEADEPSAIRWTLGRLRFAAGSEWDTNARRSVQGTDVEGGSVAFPDANRPFEVVEDGLMRVVVDSAGGLQFGDNHTLRGHYVLGAKRFFGEQTEDLLVQEVGLASQHGLRTPLAVNLDATYKGSRIRSGLRDYDVMTAGLGGIARFGAQWQLDVQTRITRFEFATEPRFDYWGPRASLGVRFQPSRRFSVVLRGGLAGRFYDGRALVEGVFDASAGSTQTTGDEVILTFCENAAAELADGYICEPAGRRRDVEITASANISYRGPFLLSGQYLLRLQRSNSDFENIDRHRVEVSATFGLPWRFTLNVLGALQFNQGVSITDQKFLADADENQNSVNVGLQRPITDGLYLEARYALYTNQFTAADVTFLRQTFYLGLGYRADLVGLSR